MPFRINDEHRLRRLRVAGIHFYFSLSRRKEVHERCLLSLGALFVVNILMRSLPAAYRIDE
jgi:hypothetical protein